MFSMLIYDIPERSGVQNPSRHLRRMAVRLNLSCWLVRSDRLPNHVLVELSQGGASWHVLPFAETASGSAKEIAKERLQVEISEATKRLRKAIATKPADDSPKEKRKAADRVRRASVRLQTLLSDLEQAADELGVSYDFNSAHQTLRRLDAQAEHVARAYLVAAASLPEADPIRQAAQADLVPAPILADYAQDHGNFTEGELALVTALNGNEVDTFEE